MSIGERLREERVRLSLSQELMGEIAGVRKQAQLKYEKGERSPDAAYLAAIAAAGADVLYVVTGQRSGEAPAVPANPREKALLDNYRHSPDAGKDAIERTASALAQSAGMKKAG